MNSTEPPPATVAERKQLWLSHSAEIQDALSRWRTQPCRRRTVESASQYISPSSESWQEASLIRIPKPKKEPRPRPQWLIDALAEHKAARLKAEGPHPDAVESATAPGRSVNKKRQARVQPELEDEADEVSMFSVLVELFVRWEHQATFLRGKTC